MDFIEVFGKTVDEAISKGCTMLGLSRDDIEVTVLEEPSSGFLGFGKKEARLRITPKGSDGKETVEVTSSFVEKIKDKAESVEERFDEITDRLEDTFEAISDRIEDKFETLLEKTPFADKEDDEEEENHSVPTASPEEIAQIADTGRQFLYSVFEKMNLKVMIEKMISSDRITFQVHGEDLGILIGKHGQTLDSLQYLTNLVANKGMANRCYIIVDVENYRSRREETLVQLAKRLGDKVRRTKKRVVLEPMNAYERKIIHLTLQDMPKVKTDSEGEGSYRHVVISYRR